MKKINYYFLSALFASVLMITNAYSYFYAYDVEKKPENKDHTLTNKDRFFVVDYSFVKSYLGGSHRVMADEKGNYYVSPSPSILVKLETHHPIMIHSKDLSFYHVRVAKFQRDGKVNVMRINQANVASIKLDKNLPERVSTFKPGETIGKVYFETPNGGSRNLKIYK